MFLVTRRSIYQVTPDYMVYKLDPSVAGSAEHKGSTYEETIRDLEEGKQFKFIELSGETTTTTGTIIAIIR